MDDFRRQEGEKTAIISFLIIFRPPYDFEHILHLFSISEQSGCKQIRILLYLVLTAATK